jgi:ankyrin repeat protein
VKVVPVKQKRVWAIVGAVAGVGALVGIISVVRLESQQRLDKALIKAVMANDVAGAEQLLNQGASANAQLPTPGRKIQAWTWNEIKSWWEWRDSPAYYPRPALQLAAGYPVEKKGANTEMVKLLLERGATPNSIGQHGETPLLAAIRRDNIGAVNLLLDRGISLNPNDHNASPLVAAASAGGPGGNSWPGGKHAPELIRLLLARGMDVNALDSSRMTVLSHACLMGNRITFRELLANGALINPTRDKESAPLVAAALYGDPQIVGELLKRGAQVNATGIGGQTALMAAVDGERGKMMLPPYSPNRDQRATIRLLLQNGAKVNVQDMRRRTPLAVALKSGDQEVIQMLRTRGAKQ